MRYSVLVLLNLPVILLALINIVTQFKLRRVSKARFRQQIIVWLVILAVLICSFPLYNHLVGRAILDSSELSAFDIVETTALIFLFYIINNQRQQIERNDHVLRDLHREISIRLSEEEYEPTSKSKRS